MLLRAEALSISPLVPPTLGESRSGGGGGGHPPQPHLLSLPLISPSSSLLAQQPQVQHTHGTHSLRRNARVRHIYCCIMHATIYSCILLCVRLHTAVYVSICTYCHICAIYVSDTTMCRHNAICVLRCLRCYMCPQVPQGQIYCYNVTIYGALILLYAYVSAYW